VTFYLGLAAGENAPVIRSILNRTFKDFTFSLGGPNFDYVRCAASIKKVFDVSRSFKLRLGRRFNRKKQKAASD
jgi:hypothetical protein